MTTRRETNAAIDETTTRLPATVDRPTRDPDPAPGDGSSQPAGTMANPAAAAPGRVAVLGAAAGERRIVQNRKSKGLLTSETNFANMAGDVRNHVWPSKPKNNGSHWDATAFTSQQAQQFVGGTKRKSAQAGSKATGTVPVDRLTSELLGLLAFLHDWGPLLQSVKCVLCRPCNNPKEARGEPWTLTVAVPGSMSRDALVMHDAGGTASTRSMPPSCSGGIFQMGLLVKEHAGAFAGVINPRSATAGQRIEERQRHRLPSVDVADYPHLAGIPPLPPADEPLDLYEVTIYERGWTPEIVFLGSRQDCLDFAEECRDETIGCCEFRVRRSGRTIGGMEGGVA